MHIGSQILSTEPFTRAIEALSDLGEFDVYDLGGGLGVRYTYGDKPPSVEEWVDALVGAARKHLPSSAKLMIEPGRSMVARSGVTLYRVLSVKRGKPTFVAVDGGMGDNLEVSLYGQRFEASVVNRVGGGTPVELVGRHCESGDRLISGVPLSSPTLGDVVVVAVTGAYCFTMANNYNGALRPAVVFCRDGIAQVRVRRETLADFVSRDVLTD
jgi:diaminopimelate decarboxylase